MAQVGTNQTISGTANPHDAQGNPAKVDPGSYQFESSDTSIVAVEPGAAENEVVCRPQGPLGTVTIRVSADADLGEGVKTIMGESEPLMVIEGEAAGFTFTFGPPTANPPA